MILVSKEQDCFQRCDHDWQFTNWLYNVRQFVTDMRCLKCGEKKTRYFNPETKVFEEWEIVKEGKAIKRAA